jgi:hypothetical protein
MARAKVGIPNAAALPQQNSRVPAMPVFPFEFRII